MKADNLFHVGIVTDDPDATRADLAALFGYEWGPEVGGPVVVSLPGGTREVDMRCAYSITTPRLEVVRSVPGTMWEPVAGAGVHHLGYWSDDVAADAAELAAAGYVPEATRTGPDGVPFFAFLRSAKGFRVELVTRAARSGLERCWSDPNSV
ncbi:VOC family protein [Rhodococcus sp. NPDC004095]